MAAVGQITQFDTISLPTDNSVAVLVNPSEYSYCDASISRAMGTNSLINNNTGMATHFMSEWLPIINIISSSSSSKRNIIQYCRAYL